MKFPVFRQILIENFRQEARKKLVYGKTAELECVFISSDLILNIKTALLGDSKIDKPDHYDVYFNGYSSTLRHFLSHIYPSDMIKKYHPEYLL